MTQLFYKQPISCLKANTQAYFTTLNTTNVNIHVKPTPDDTFISRFLMTTSGAFTLLRRDPIIRLSAERPTRPRGAI